MLDDIPISSLLERCTKSFDMVLKRPSLKSLSHNKRPDPPIRPVHRCHLNQLESTEENINTPNVHLPPCLRQTTDGVDEGVVTTQNSDLNQLSISEKQLTEVDRGSIEKVRRFIYTFKTKIEIL